MSRGWWWWALGIRRALFEAWYLGGVVQVGGSSAWTLGVRL